MSTHCSELTIILIIRSTVIIRIILIISIIRIILIVSFSGAYGTRYRGSHWLDKRAAIAQTVDELGDNFKPAMRAGWMAYIRKAHPDGRIAVGQGQLVFD